jgi:site-specific recombinase XerD
MKNYEPIIRQRIERMRVVMATSKDARALTTESSYTGHLRAFMRFSVTVQGFATLPPEELARLYVESKARHWSVASVNQFRNALVFYYRHVIGKPLGNLGTWAEAKRPKKLPVWLAHDDMMALIACLKGQNRLMAEIGYGSGLRSHDLASLRWKDIHYAQRQIVIRSGKGDKDRATFLPSSCIPALKEQEQRMRALWEHDRRHNRPGVEVPSTKFTGKDWPWFWVWAGNNESRDPRSGIVRRHHVHRDTLGKAISAAVRIWGGNQRVTVHSLRHSFATEMLMSGMPIQELQEVMGHKHVTTTQIYAHCLPRLTTRRESPMDRAAGNVVAFESAHNQPLRRVS